MTTNYGRNIAKARQGAGMTQSQAADKLGISQGYLAGLEVGRNNPDLFGLLAGMREVYGRSLDVVLLGLSDAGTVQETNDILSRLSPERCQEVLEIAKLFLLLDSVEYRKEVMRDLIAASAMLDNNRVLNFLIAAREKIGEVDGSLTVDSLGLAN